MAEETNDIMFEENFDGDLKGGFAAKLLNISQVELAKGEGPDGSNAIRVAYEGYERGSRRVVLRHGLNDEAAEATLSYDVCFDSDFQFTLGGKLHGLGPENPVTGGRQRSPERWSARVNFKQDGHCATYLYDQNLDKKFGVGETSNAPVFTKGKWHHVDLELSLNQPSIANGFARVSIDSETVLMTDGMMFRGDCENKSLISTFLFSTFHGGSKPIWTPVDDDGNPTTVHALFDNFKIVKGVRK